MPAEVLTARCQSFVAAWIAAHLDDAAPEALGTQAALTVAVVDDAVGDRAAVEHGIEDAGRLLVVAGPEERPATHAFAAAGVALAGRDSP